MTKSELEDELEEFRQLVIASRTDPKVEKKCMASLDRLNDCFQEHPTLFSTEDIRWLNVLRGYLGVRLDSHKPGNEHTRQPKRKGDALDHCWRCETPIDERFVEFCTSCSSKTYQWRTCPICRACGCQRAGGGLV